MPSSPASGRLRRAIRPRRRACAIAVCGLAVCGVSLTGGCSAPPPRAAPSITLSSAQVTQPGAGGVTDIYVDVKNTGAADQLIGARISVGGSITLRSPVGTDVMDMHTVRAIMIPAKSFVGLDPNGPHLLVTHAGKMISGREIIVTFLFAHAGAISVSAMVTNPATGGASYFLN